eukprot:CAMPEP_0185594710 /NCGR_PEP_ID=MMETSP0434-20130131/75925_1 /TAXON_ID=626734 ORGANISM="Favella taraikaensis, Strain Fe Narragansett Bay" /NCGR_SAMPLE_ID=MMETSP0434 /ASSEMBLY_ACC=CAM_ASM_000379 /LENGTH=92 /DNA_ID=CAMNT_0028222229 /DNA_START=974 /DNA_END=1252 /DNA_ORIENTATION=-
MTSMKQIKDIQGGLEASEKVQKFYKELQKTRKDNPAKLGFYQAEVAELEKYFTAEAQKAARVARKKKGKKVGVGLMVAGVVAIGAYAVMKIK